MKKILLKSLLFLPILLLVVCTNYVVDPANVFHSRIEHDLARLILDGHSVANVGNCDERLLQKYIIEGTNVPRDVIVLGSSRVMQLRSESFPGQTFFNHAVSGATLEDLVAMVAMYEEKGGLPQSIVLGVDPWIFNAHHQQFRWESLATEYRGYRERLIGEPGQRVQKALLHEKWRTMISPSYFQESLRHALVRTFRPGVAHTYYVTTESEPDAGMIRADGWRCATGEKRNRSESAVDLQAGRFLARDPIYSMGDFYEIDEGYLALFRLFLDDLQAQDIRVILFLAPYHPDVHVFMASHDDYAILSDVEDLIRAVAMERDVPLLGSYDPARYGLSSRDFFDGMHPRPDTVARLFAPVAHTEALD